MKPQQFIRLIACVIAGALWIYLGQDYVLINLLAEPFSGGGMDFTAFLETASSPSFIALWFTCIAVTLIWLTTTSNRSPVNSAEVRKMRRSWWICASVLVFFGWFYQFVFTVLIWQLTGSAPFQGAPGNYFPVPPGGWLTLLVLVILDVGLLFWLPTMLATPKSYKLVVPGALKYQGGR